MGSRSDNAGQEARGGLRFLDITCSGRGRGTLDSDAALLDDEAIAALSRAHIAGQVQAVHKETEEESAELRERRRTFVQVQIGNYETVPAS